MLIKEITIFIVALFTSILAIELDSWNLFILYWLIRIYVEITWGEK